MGEIKFSCFAFASSYDYIKRFKGMRSIDVLEERE